MSRSPSSSPPSPPSSTRYSSYDLAILNLVSLHLLFSFAAAAFVLLFHFRSSPSPSPSLRRRLRLLLRLNSLWPVRLLLLLFASLLSLSELLRLPPLYRCNAYSLTSLSFAQPAFFAALLILLRASVTPSSSLSFAFAFSVSVVAALPFLVLQALFIALSPWALRKLSLPADFLSPATVKLTSADHRCTRPLYTTALLALLGAVYVPLFISACWSAVTVVINKKLRIRLYALAGTVVAALSVQVTSLALSSLWSPSRTASQGLGLMSYAAVLVCVAVGEGILVVQPVVDALAIVEPERPACDSRGAGGGELEV